MATSPPLDGLPANTGTEHLAQHSDRLAKWDAMLERSERWVSCSDYDREAVGQGHLSSFIDVRNGSFFTVQRPLSDTDLCPSRVTRGSGRTATAEFGQEQSLGADAESGHSQS